VFTLDPEATLLLNKVKLWKTGTTEYAEPKRQFGWEFNDMRLHSPASTAGISVSRMKTFPARFARARYHRQRRWLNGINRLWMVWLERPAVRFAMTVASTHSPQFTQRQAGAEDSSVVSINRESE
jgi:hypothetical protein